MNGGGTPFRGRTGRRGRGPINADSDRCRIDALEISIQELHRSPYFQTHNALPDPATEVTLGNTPYSGRIPVLIESEILGVLPSKFDVAPFPLTPQLVTAWKVHFSLTPRYGFLSTLTLVLERTLVAE